LDTGALYRAVTWLALEHKCEEPFSILQAIKDHPIKDHTIMIDDMRCWEEPKSGSWIF